MYKALLIGNCILTNGKQRDDILSTNQFNSKNSVKYFISLSITCNSVNPFYILCKLNIKVFFCENFCNLIKNLINKPKNGLEIYLKISIIQPRVQSVAK